MYLKFVFTEWFEKLKIYLIIFFRTTVEQLQNEINALDSRFKVVRKQIELPNTEQDIKNQMIEFLKVTFRQIILFSNNIRLILINNTFNRLLKDKLGAYKVISLSWNP